MTCKQEIADRLSAARDRTFGLLRMVPDEYLKRRVHDFYSPVGWHFGHIARTEEHWVARATGSSARDEGLSFLFADLPENPKHNRTSLPEKAKIVAYLRETREDTLRALERAELDPGEPLLADGYAWLFALQHECQHQETILELLCLIHRDRGAEPSGEPPRWEPGVERAEEVIEGGSFCMGSSSPLAYDNEKEPHTVVVLPFVVDRHPVTAYDWSLFVAQGGYEDASLWSDEGWRWRTAESASMPEYWKLVDGAWYTFCPNGLRPVQPDEPAASVSKHEAEAYAKWTGKRLLTEAEREFLAQCAIGRAGGPALAARSVGSGSHVCDLSGCIWEWTSSAFLPYPGFAAFPYEGYSKAHMDGRHFVCRGGSWASADDVLRPSFRNWYVPTYRQGFLGLRLASNPHGRRM